MVQTIFPFPLTLYPALQAQNYSWWVISPLEATGLMLTFPLIHSLLAFPKWSMVSLQTTFAITLPQMGWLQSAMLWGYVVGQIPTGRMADRIGGSPMMQLSIILW